MGAADFVARPLRVLGRLLRGEDPFTLRRSRAEWESDYRERRWDHLIGDQRAMGNMAVVAHLLSAAAGDERRRLLDVGCGNGGLLTSLGRLTKKFEYVGVDLSSEALAQLNAAHPGAKTIRADMADVEKIPGEFDVLVFNESLYYADCAVVLEKYRTKAAPDALLIVSMHARGSRPILWARIAAFTTELQSFTIKDDASGTAWTVKLLRYAAARR